MGFKVNFQDNQNVSAVMLNSIAQDITEEPEFDTVFADDTLYGVDDLNAITSTLITKGVSKGMAVSVSGSSVTISHGTAFFEDGKKITVDTDGVILPWQEGNTNYVWFSNDLVSGSVSAKCTTTEPDGDYIKLCEISPAGVVTMKQDIALMKNASLLPNHHESVSLTVKSGHNYDDAVFEYSVPAGHSKMIAKGYHYHAYFDFDNNTVSVGSVNGMRTGEIGSIFLELSYETYVYITSYKNGVLTLEVRYSGSLSNTSEPLEIDFL